ncbi:MAG TPA: hypothetical protein VLF62_04985 [Candidatus Saccharimonadales bacterium]|nr:hypothetical protein [Candidatus Saccharimonadales bacterium]
MNKLGIVFSGRVRSALTGTLALWVLLYMSTYNGEVVAAYLGGSGFDATARAAVIHLLLFLPYYLLAAVVLHGLAMRLALFHALKRHITSVEYMPAQVLTPIEASLLANGRFTINGLAGTIKDLELRGCLSVTKNGGNMVIRPANMAVVTDDERTFIMALAGATGEFSTAHTQSTETLLAAGHTYSEVVRAKLVGSGQLVANSGSTSVIRASTSLLLWIMLAAQSVLTVHGITSANGFFHVGYPRYAMAGSEPLLAAAGSLLVFAIGVGGFWRRNLTDAHGLKNWRYVAALRVLIEKTYKDRFYRDGKQMASEQDMRTFYPYALALGVERRFSDELRRALGL